MSSGKSKRFAGSRLTAALLLAGWLVLGSGSTAMAQSENAGSPKGLEGTWRAEVKVLDCQNLDVVLRSFPAILSFARGGTLTFTTGGQPPSLFTAGLGIWNHLYGQTYSAVSEAFFFNPAGTLTSTQRLTRVIEVGRNGNEYKDVIGQEILDTNGNVITTGCGTTEASRLE